MEIVDLRETARSRSLFVDNTFVGVFSRICGNAERFEVGSETIRWSFVVRALTPPCPPIIGDWTCTPRRAVLKTKYRPLNAELSQFYFQRGDFRGIPRSHLPLFL